MRGFVIAHAFSPMIVMDKGTVRTTVQATGTALWPCRLQEVGDEKAKSSDLKHPGSRDLDLAIIDEYWEYADPNPDIIELFNQYNDMFFDGLLGVK